MQFPVLEMPAAIQTPAFITLTQKHTGITKLNVNGLWEIIVPVKNYMQKANTKEPTLWGLERFIRASTMLFGASHVAPR